jgi:hypothetical protein
MVFVPKPGKMISKFGVFVEPPDVPVKQLLFGVACGLQHLDFMPWYKTLVESTKSYCGKQEPVPLAKFKNRHHLFDGKMVFRPVTWIPETDVDIMMRYNIDTEFFRILDNNIHFMQFRHPYLQCMFDRETDGPKEIY